MHSINPLILPFALYAETHFRFFKFFPSLLFRKIPEVIFDCPRRLNPGLDLPVLLLLNDIDRFPARCTSVEIIVSQKSRPPRRFRFDNVENNGVDHPFSFQSSAYLFNLRRNELPEGHIYINCRATIEMKSKSIQIVNDNLPGSSKFSFSCYISNAPLPGSQFCSMGDVHVHSQYSQSHVEFGPPIQIIDLFSKCYGNDFTVITDHSYDLACTMKNYLKPDWELARWRYFLQDISRKDLKNVIVAGEEVSCLNSKSKAIHLCAMGLGKYIPGTLDGARSKTKKDNQLTAATAISQVHSQQGVAFAAHPGSKIGFMQRFFLKRGVWGQKDFSLPLDGIQGVNNGFLKSWNRAKVLWLNELKKGHKLSLVAGNDSHGDFNRYRYLSIPFISISESFKRYFSNAMTGIYTKISNQDDVIKGLKEGKTFITSGPYLSIGLASTPMKSIVSKADNDLTDKEIAIALISNVEFGFPYCIRLFFGEMRHQSESLIFCKYFKEKQYTVTVTQSLINMKHNGYIRAESECLKEDGSLSFSATSPCYFRSCL